MRGMSRIDSTENAQTVLDRGCTPKWCMRGIDGDDIASSRGEFNHSMVANDHAVLEQCCGFKSLIIAKDREEIDS